MDKEILRQYILEGKTQMEIGALCGLNYRTVSYWIRKHRLFEITARYAKDQCVLDNKFLETIDTKEKAYVVGFILGVGHICAVNKEHVEICSCLADREVLDNIAPMIKANVKEDLKYNKKSRIFPHVTITKRIPHITKHLGGRLKKERHFPRVKDALAPYLLLGFFDADGHITCGYRKDRGRFWITVGFTHHLKCLLGLQQFLLKKLGIATAVHPKQGEDAFCIRLSGRKEVMTLLDYIYSDEQFIMLKRKYEKYNAVRLELGEFGEGCE